MGQHTSAQPDYGTGQKTLGIYFLGVMGCVVLTLIAFGSVMIPGLSRPAIFSIIFTSAIFQFLIQIICFLRLNIKTEQSQLNVMAFVYTLVIMLCIIAGSMWIMWNLDYYMAH